MSDNASVAPYALVFSGSKSTRISGSPEQQNIKWQQNTVFGQRFGFALKKTLSLSTVFAGVLVLAGCASIGGTGFGPVSFGGAKIDASISTASTGEAVQSQLDQAMPGNLSNNAATITPGGPYLPPGNVGGAGLPPPFAVASVSRSQLPPPIINNSTLAPALVSPSTNATPQSTSVGSQQTMPAQTQSVVTARVTQPFQDSSVPQTSGTSAPTLTVVPNEGFKHTVESGESLYAIARRYNVKTDEIVRVNGLNSADQIFVGQKIIIPGREDLLAAQTAATPAPAASPPVAPTTPTQPTRVASIAQSASVAPETSTPPVAAAQGFRWPVNGRVIVDFEQSRRTGINIEAPEGSVVRAAEGGTVIYIGDGIEGFGNLILVRHPNGYVSAYAHLKGFSVVQGAQVRRGDQIGSVGMTGSVNRPQLHFELRQGATPVDPMPLLAT